MKRRTFLSDVRPLRTGLLLCLAGVLPAATLNAADLRESKTSTDGRTSKTETPLFVLNCAGAARILDDLDTVCRSVKRGELALAVRAVLALSGDLKGIDRTRPFGLMTFINAGEVPEPVAVAYVPITSFDDLRQTLKKISQVTLSADQDRDGTYALETPVGTFRLVRRGKYIFIARQSLSLKRHFGDPAQRFATLTRRHDLAVEFRLSAVPTGMKTMILDYLRAGVDSKLRSQRDESLQQRRFRRDATLAAVSLFERILLDGERMTFGWNLSKQHIRAKLELQLVARPGTRLALQLKQRFAILRFAPASDNAPLTLSAVWRFGQTE
ncbi:MAG: hypothetical protein IID46_01940, partial [Planctomycetes bacterium]|nr:hypothetical protein [Planctomycetota bacterium]